MSPELVNFTNVYPEFGSFHTKVTIRSQCCMNTDLMCVCVHEMNMIMLMMMFDGDNIALSVTLRQHNVKSGLMGNSLHGQCQALFCQTHLWNSFCYNYLQFTHDVLFSKLLSLSWHPHFSVSAEWRR